jgi:hypothetical protein
MRTFSLNTNTLPVWWEYSQHSNRGADVMSKIMVLRLAVQNGFLENRREWI